MKWTWSDSGNHGTLAEDMGMGTLGTIDLWWIGDPLETGCDRWRAKVCFEGHGRRSQTIVHFMIAEDEDGEESVQQRAEAGAATIWDTLRLLDALGEDYRCPACGGLGYHLDTYGKEPCLLCKETKTLPLCRAART